MKPLKRTMESIKVGTLKRAITEAVASLRETSIRVSILLNIKVMMKMMIFIGVGSLELKAHFWAIVLNFQKIWKTRIEVGMATSYGFHLKYRNAYEGLLLFKNL
jgi:hypothetical protein